MNNDQKTIHSLVSKHPQCFTDMHGLLLKIFCDNTSEKQAVLLEWPSVERWDSQHFDSDSVASRIFIAEPPETFFC